MKTNMSVLFSDARGKAGNVVASKWKGRNYVRSLVTPANPQSAAQTAVRTSMARCVEIWHALSSAVKDAWDPLGTARQMSGFNAFIKNNRANEQETYMTEYTPANSDVTAPDNVVAATGASPGGDIDVSWDVGSATGTDPVAVWVRKSDGQAVSYDEPAGVTIADEAHTVGSLEYDEAYVVCIAAIRAVDGYSLSQGNEATASSET